MDGYHSGLSSAYPEGISKPTFSSKLVYFAVLATKNEFTHHLRMLHNHCVLTPALLTNMHNQHTTPYELVLEGNISTVPSACPPTKFP
jgi:hypothetical protein